MTTIDIIQVVISVLISVFFIGIVLILFVYGICFWRWRHYADFVSGLKKCGEDSCLILSVTARGERSKTA